MEVVTNFKQPRVRSKRYMDWLAKQPCALTGTTLIHRHHLTCGPEPKARSETASDIWAIPLAAQLHDPNSGASVHFSGDEQAWWKRRGIPDPTALCINHLAAYAAEQLGAHPVLVEQIRRGALSGRVRAKATKTV
jgi:hypothetical protein